ncbi:MAG: ABC transporter permease subunit [Pseudomonadota bacterium]
MNKAVDTLIIGFAWLSGIILTIVVGVLIGYLLFKGAGTLGPALIFGDTTAWDALFLRRQVFDGLFPAMVGTLAVVSLSIVIAVPVGVASGITMSELATGRVHQIFGLFFDILAAVPSIVIGLFGFSVAVFLHHAFSGRIGPCLLISALSLAFLVLPYLIRSTQTAMESLPTDLRLTAPALGATRLQNIRYVLLPQSLTGILSGVILAIGRCAEDTAVIMLTGVVATAGIPGSVLSQYEALPFYIYYISAQYADPQELARGYGAAIVLLAVCALLLGLANVICHRLNDHLLYGTR